MSKNETEFVSLITGGASGICKEVAINLCEYNQCVVVVDSDLGELSKLKCLGLNNLKLFHFDIQNSSHIDELYDLLERNELLPDILINGVGGDARKIPFEELAEEYLTLSLQQNLMTAFNLIQKFIPEMREKGFGRVVNFASVAGRTYTLFSNTAYVCSKSAVIGLTKQLAYEYANEGITVNAVAHGPIATQRIQNAWASKTEREQQGILEKIPVGRLGTVEEAAAAVMYLCSKDASYTTGAVLDVNGGMYI